MYVRYKQLLPWDESKNESNKRDHGISFETAHFVFDDYFAVTFDDYVDENGEMRYQTIGSIDGALIFVAHVYRFIEDVETPGSLAHERRSTMKKNSTGQLSETGKREIAALKAMPDSEVNFKDIPLHDPDDPKWKNGQFFRVLKTPVTVRLDSDIVAWLKSKEGRYQQHMNAMLRSLMLAEKRR